MTQTFKFKESRKHITISSSEGKIEVEKMDVDDKNESAQIHIRISKSKKKEWMDFVDENENVQNMTHLLKEGPAVPPKHVAQKMAVSNHLACGQDAEFPGIAS